MLARHIFGYTPSLIVPGLVSFASLYFFTHLLSPEGYGHYVLAVNMMTMLVGVGFYWLQSAASRLLPEAVEQGREAPLSATLLGAQLVCSVVLLIVSLLLIAFVPLGDWKVAAWFAPPLAILRALLNLNQAYHRNFLHIGRYNVLEVGQSLLGLLLALGFIYLLGMEASGAALGMMLGLAIMAGVDWRLWAKVDIRKFDRGLFREISVFGLPFVVNYGLSFVLSRSDSFLIQYFHGASEVGIYNAGYAFPDRVGQYLFMAVATAAFPLTVRLLEQRGVEAARRQTYVNGTAMLALAIPACIGLLYANDHIVAALIGPEYHEGARRIMPWITVAMILNGMAAHYFDHSLHLAKKTKLYLIVLGPAALLNFVANLWAIPAFGAIGAAYTTLASYVLYLTLSIVVGNRVFPMQFPFKPALQIVGATAVMAAVLEVASFPETMAGLIDLIMTGALAYGAGLLIFDAMGARRMLWSVMNQCIPVKRRIAADYEYKILRSPAEIATVREAWDVLREQGGSSVFTSPDWHAIWAQTLAEPCGDKPLIVAAYRQDKLAALLPLAVRKVRGVRIAEWSGQAVFDINDVVAVDAAAAQAVWDYAFAKGGFDVCTIRDVRETAMAHAYLAEKLVPYCTKKNYVLAMDFKDGEAWLAAQSRKLRGQIRRHREKLAAEQGEVTFAVWGQGEGERRAIIDALYKQKLDWFHARGATGVFEQAQVRDFLQRLAEDAARKGELYLATLSCGGKIVACHMGFIRKGVLGLYHTTYDGAFGDYSPGILLMADSIKWAADHEIVEFDFLRGDEAYKERFASSVRELTGYIGARTWLGSFAAIIHALKVMLSKKDA